MTIERQVTCISKKDRFNPHERIQRIGGASSSTLLTALLASPWTMTENEAIAAINSGQYTFYTMVNGQRANVRVARSLLHGEYLTTHPDDEKQNNLLHLPECPR